MVYHNHALYIIKLIHTYTQVEKEIRNNKTYYIHIYGYIWIYIYITTYIIYVMHIVYTYKLYVIYVKFYGQTPFLLLILHQVRKEINYFIFSYLYFHIRSIIFI